MMTNVERPLDVLGKSRGNKVIIELKSGEKVTGAMVAFDIHLNMWVREASIEKGSEKRKLGSILVRGDNILFISPE